MENDRSTSSPYEARQEALMNGSGFSSFMARNISEPNSEVPRISSATTQMAKHAHPARYKGAPDFGDSARSEEPPYQGPAILNDEERDAAHLAYLAATEEWARIRAEKQKRA